MRIVQLLGHSTGGIGTHVAHLTEQLRDAGEEVVVVGPAGTVERFDMGRSWCWWPLARGPRALLAAVRGLRRTRAMVASADVLHAHGHQAGLVAATLLLGLRVRGRRGPRLVVSWHNAVLPAPGAREPAERAQHAIPHKGGGWRGWVQRYAVRRADLVSGASRDLVAGAERLGAQRARLAAVPSPRVPGLLARAPADAAERRVERGRLLRAAGVVADADLPLVLTVSRVAPQKDLPVLVDAAARLSGRCSWVVVGSGDTSLTVQLRDRAAAAGAPVHLVGRSDVVEQWLRAAEVFVLPSRWEARALVVQEAMAAGTPVVTTDVGGLRDLVAGVGTTVPPGDVAALAEATRELLADPGLRTAGSRRAREAAAHLPDVEDMTREWRGWYAELVSMT
jgi:glycosyltransferase involved in cell wall biosynthesis